MLTAQIDASEFTYSLTNECDGRQLHDMVETIVKDVKIGTSYLLAEDEQGRRYHHIINPFSTDFDMYFRTGRLDTIGHCFTSNAPQAIEAIRRGYGDTLLMVPGTHITGDPDIIVKAMAVTHRFCVIRYLDREYGEHVRKDMIEKLQAAQYAYGLVFDSFGMNRLYLTYDMIDEDVPDGSQTNIYNDSKYAVMNKRKYIITTFSQLTPEETIKAPTWARLGELIKDTMEIPSHLGGSVDYKYPKDTERMLRETLKLTMVLKN